MPRSSFGSGHFYQTLLQAQDYIWDKRQIFFQLTMSTNSRLVAFYTGSKEDKI